MTAPTNALGASIDLVGHIIGNIDRLIGDVRRDGAQVARQSQALYRTATERAGSMRDVVRAGPRMARIVGEGMRIIGRYRLHRSWARSLPPEVAARRLDAIHRASAERLYRLCVELRGGVLKLGQFISCRMDILPPAYVEELSTLQDRVPPIPFEEICARLEQELGQPTSDLFAELDPEPIAAASLAQVHRAVLPDGREVAVKVLVPGIEEIIETDITALRVLAGAAGDLMPQVDLQTICGELSRTIHREVDFAKEAAELVRFRAAFDGDDQVVVPEVVDVYSTGKVLTMELLHGQRLTDFLDAAEPAERDTLFEVLIRSFCQQILEDGRFHADPHPGNFLVLPGPRLALLDFGCVGELTAAQRSAYARVAGAVLGRNSAEVARLLGELGFETAGGDPETLIGFADMMLEQFREGAADLGSIDPRAQLERAMEMARQSPVVSVPEEFVLLGRVFASLGGLVFHYQPDVELFRIIAPHLSNALAAA